MGSFPNSNETTVPGIWTGLTALKPRKIGQDLMAPARILDGKVPKCLYRPTLREEIDKASAIHQHKSRHQCPHVLNKAPAVCDADNHEAD